MIYYEKPDVCVFHVVNELFQEDMHMFNELTFDDGHYSVLYNEYILHNPIKKTLFITPTFINMQSVQRKKSYDSYHMYDFFVKNIKEQFLTIEEIYKLIDEYNFEIGMHSYYHDIVYCPKNVSNAKPIYRDWHYYKINNMPNSVAAKIFGFRSKLSGGTYDFISDDLRVISHNEYTDYIEEDTYKCTEWFEKYIGNVSKYAFPFFDYSAELVEVLNKYNIRDLYGKRHEI